MIVCIQFFVAPLASPRNQIRGPCAGICEYEFKTLMQTLSKYFVQITQLLVVKFGEVLLSQIYCFIYSFICLFIHVYCID
jgi:hypothetical protein